MNTPNPLLPQGTTPSKATSKIGFKILMILAIHVVVIGGLLMQGCSKDKAATTPKEGDTNAVANGSPMSATPDFTPAPLNSNAVAGAPMAAPVGANPASQPAPTAVASTPGLAPMTPAPMTPAPTAALPVDTTAMSAPAAAHEYVIVAGDTLAVIAKHNGVSVKSIQEANPGIEPKKLKIGAKLQIPGGKEATATAARSSAPTADVAAAPAGDVATYTVKSGDRLLKIASAHGTTVKAILALNDMKTTSIRAGQKIKVPVMKVASADAAPKPVSAAPMATPASGTAAPMPATSAN